MNNYRRLLILSCSQRKHTTQSPLPAIKRYKGQFFLVLGRFLRECPRQARLLDVYILSAAYGLIPGDFLAKWYDRKMNLSRAVELQSEVNTVFSDILSNNYTAICMVLGKTYQKSFENALELIPSDIDLVMTRGRIGEQQAQLKKWLWRENRHTRIDRSPNEIGNN